MHEGRFLPMACDVAAMMPMVEMSRDHTFFIPDVLYLYNRDNPLNDDRISASMQELYNQYVRSLPPYQQLEVPPYKEHQLSGMKSDIVCFSYDRPLQLYAFLESVERYVKNYGEVKVIWRASSDAYEKGYALVKEKFPAVTFIQQNDKSAKKDFKKLVMKATFEGNPYITFATDDLVVKDDIDFSRDIRELEKTQMHALFYRLGKHVDYCYMAKERQAIPPLSKVGDDLFAWQYKQATHDWSYPHSVDFTLYRKRDIEDQFKQIACTYPNDLEALWDQMGNLKQYGLCHAESKIVNFPLNVSNNYNEALKEYPVELLLDIFMSGKKIDLGPVHKIENRSPHMEYHPTFVLRD